MNISIGLKALEEKQLKRRFSQKQKENIANAMATKTPVGFSTNQHVGGKTYSLAFITAFDKGAEEDVLSFEPIACRAYQVVNAMTRELRLLTVDFYERGQYSFDFEGSKRTTYKLDGEGCDPEMKPEPSVLLKRLISSGNGGSILRHAKATMAELFDAKK